jgi:hypothetical protein
MNSVASVGFALRRKTQFERSLLRAILLEPLPFQRLRIPQPRPPRYARPSPPPRERQTQAQKGTPLLGNARLAPPGDLRSEVRIKLFAPFASFVVASPHVPSVLR